MIKILATDTQSILTLPFTSYFNSMTTKSTLQFTFHYLFNFGFENKAQYSGPKHLMRFEFITGTPSKFKMDTHFGVVPFTHRPLSYFTNDDDIHFSAISNQTDFPIDKHMSYINISTEKHMSYIYTSLDKHMSCIYTSLDKHMSCIYTSQR